MGRVSGKECMWLNNENDACGKEMLGRTCVSER